ncbi:hypothetical protein DPMN_117927 [Dreissena polymorpha]|uniref:Uncharacterized protein n=1 Tax=Dreissena polymorpha TaxID=45954 RepID=A0A9D4JL76_DREPO|nr:hypothetical protein DPMN_117927 [Dreissena polymorpha]
MKNIEKLAQENTHTSIHNGHVLYTSNNALNHNSYSGYSEFTLQSGGATMVKGHVQW